ncbi:metal ABC transporter substrate-binding protein [Natronomonas sp. LN261]|uniref:metal ABC transporter substrate-binding protein n=1 Tax=Natronomonas sp. LN261 TaxID=2750669 RepID=UPI0015EE6A5D|nr:metal ABC transporter substrate-binding protein [Natronomonas sp. LN261]
MVDTTRRQLLTATAGVGGIGLFAGCIGSDAGTDSAPATGSADRGTTAQASFFVFGDITQQIAGDAATAELLVPVGQHGHGWEPGPNVRQAIYEADLFVHGMESFQPWVDTIVRDLSADGAGVTTLDIGRGVDLLEAGGDDEHTDDEHTDDEHTDDEHTDDEHTDDEHDRGSVDPHFWMDPLRVKEAAETVREGLIDADPDSADTYADNTARFRTELDALHGRAESIVADAGTETILVAGHNSLRYFGDRYGINVESLTGVSPDDIPTPRDIERAQSIIDDHDLQYVCADPLESQRAADQLVAETDVEDVLDLTAMPGLTEAWESKGWGYVDVMENVNLPTLERALNA